MQQRICVEEIDLIRLFYLGRQTNARSLFYLPTSNVQCRISNDEFQLYFNQAFRQTIPGLKHIEFCAFGENKDEKVLFEGGLHLACCHSNHTLYSPQNRIILILRHFARYANLVDSVGERVYNCNPSGNGKF